MAAVVGHGAEEMPVLVVRDSARAAKDASLAFRKYGKHVAAPEHYAPKTEAALTSSGKELTESQLLKMLKSAFKEFE